jgi:PAS domain S-box-containing protein
MKPPDTDRVPRVPGGADSADAGQAPDRGRDYAHDLFLTQARLAAIVDSSDDVIVSKTLDGVITSWNHAAQEMFGWTSAEAIGRHITLIIPAERVAEEDEVLARVRKGERVDHFETVRVTKDGRAVEMSITVSPIRDHQGRIVGASKIGRDITERRRIERELADVLRREQAAREEAEAANQAKDDFLATLSHELRTPLNAILGWTQVLSSAKHDAAVVARALETIGRNARQQARLIEDLLDLSAIVSGRLRLSTRPANLVTVLGAALETVRPEAAAKKIVIAADLDPSVGALNGDPERLQQVFWNLLSNAVKFTPQGGRIDLALARSDAHATVTLSDSGIGIRSDLLPVVFDRFRQADTTIARAHGGLGLGLAIVKQLVELHGGTVAVASPGEGQGATFTVRLPVAARPAPPADRAESDAADGGRFDGLHALLVDDEADGREMVRRLLEQCGARVTAVSSGSEALMAIRRLRPQTLISDLAMPGMDGYELMRQVRAIPDVRDTPAIALTAHVTADARIKAFKAGFDAYVAKPVDRDEILAVVTRLVHRGGLRPGL